MYNLSVDEISMVDGGGDGSVGTIVANIGCGIAGTVVGIASKSVQAGTAAGILCSQMVSNSANGNSGSNGRGGSMSMSNVQGNAGFAGGRGL
ncbi:hypothetical protein EXA23_12640 [Vibrio cincinnatiensis]|uniref:hypothetical protein n=1 Tax=Vibrio cincinnatiensis TaxID=675 RepID=UPI001EDD4150|nr:hypothetical protein [Vibrio cincinnatiensis]MCG3767040.1 hypothetical protein [Vibrio cincinnatiensis]